MSGAGTGTPGRESRPRGGGSAEPPALARSPPSAEPVAETSPEPPRGGARRVPALSGSLVGFQRALAAVPNSPGASLSPAGISPEGVG